jgi:glyoxylase-like metal-dependent hydrolase (beta-lactamase superfamily II)
VSAEKAGAPSVEVIADGTFALDGGAMFGIVPRPVWEKEMVPDAAHRVRLGLNCLLVRAAGRIVLVDTGVGGKGDARFVERHAVRRDGGLPAALGRRGIGPEQVTDVINSHLHWDHAGGNTLREPDGGVRPAFPNAFYYVQRGELEAARASSPRTRGSYHEDDFEPLAAAGRLVLVDGEVEIAPGVRVIPAAGHLPHMQVVLIGSGAGATFFPADLVPTAHHLAPAWGMGFDLEPLVVQRHKRHWLERAARENWRVVFYHDPDLPEARIEVASGRFAARPAHGG